MVVFGEMSLGGSVNLVVSIAECLQVAFDAGSKRAALPMNNAADIATIPPELFAKFQVSFYGLLSKRVLLHQPFNGSLHLVAMPVSTTNDLPQAGGQASMPGL